MNVFASALIWNGVFRFGLFWIFVGTGLAFVASVMPYSHWQLVFSVLKEVGAGDITRVADKTFAFSLSSAIVQFALALAFGFFVAHVLLLRAALYDAKRDLRRASNALDFAAQFERISSSLKRNAIVGPAWTEFEKTVVRQDDAVHNTIRPQAVINLSDVRDRLFGLKMMGSIPGYFVGLGLLLTFIGLVLALNNAAASTTAGSAEKMTESLNKLLEAATFKFSTSIAGLGASLLLAFLFRTYQIWIEAGFYGFCRALEERLVFHPTQKIVAESRDILAASRDELKEINSEQFFARLGQTVAPHVEGAMSAAIGPMTARLDRAMGQFAQTSQTGLNDMLQGFLNSLRGGAGVELTQVARSLDSVRSALDGVQQNLSGSGVDFAQRLTAASETLTSVVAEVGRTLGASASGVAGTVEASMAAVVQKLEALQTGMAAHAEANSRLSREAGEAAAATSRRAAQEAAAVSSASAREAMDTVRASMEEVVASLRNDIGHLSDTIRSVAAAFSNQAKQIDILNSRSRDTADAFGRVANDVRSASQPLLTQSERVAASTDRMAVSIETSVGALTATKDTATAIATQLSAHLDQIGHIWDQYEARFQRVDEDFGKAADRFHEEVSRHQESMREFVKTIDEHTGNILGKINTAVAGLNESVEALDETLDGFLQTMTSRQAAE